MPETLEGPVVQVHVGRDDVGGEALAVDGEPVVLRRDGHEAARDVLDGVIRAPVPELELERRAAKRETEELVTEADPEDRTGRDEALDRAGWLVPTPGLEMFADGD